MFALLPIKLQQLVQEHWVSRQLKGWPRPIWARYCLAVSGILVASFLAFQDEFAASKKATGERDEARRQLATQQSIGERSLGDVRELTISNSFYNATDADGMLVVRRTDTTPFTIYLPRNPITGKILDIAKASKDVSLQIIVDGGGKNINGQPQYSLTIGGQSITVRFSGIEWVIL